MEARQAEVLAVQQELHAEYRVGAPAAVCLHARRIVHGLARDLPSTSWKPKEVSGFHEPCGALWSDGAACACRACSGSLGPCPIASGVPGAWRSPT
jgi:hypothetical protein